MKCYAPNCSGLFNIGVLGCHRVMTIAVDHVKSKRYSDLGEYVDVMMNGPSYIEYNFKFVEYVKFMIHSMEICK